MKALFSAPSGPPIEYAMPLTAASNRDGGGSMIPVLDAWYASPWHVQWQGSSWRRMVLTFAGNPTKIKLNIINNGWTKPISFTMGSTSIADIRGMTEIAVAGDTSTATLQSAASSGWYRFKGITGTGIA